MSKTKKIKLNVIQSVDLQLCYSCCDKNAKTLEKLKSFDTSSDNKRDSILKEANKIVG